MKVSVIIPTYNAERWIRRQLDTLLSQTIKAEILVLDSGSTDETPAILRTYGERIRLLEIPQPRFDHGGSRDYALRESAGDIVLFLTQDALPTDPSYIEKLLSAFSASDVAAAFGRQIPWPDVPAYEKLIRQYNYPDQPRIWREEDIPRYGVKAYFFSNACSAYRREDYLQAGGFDAPILSNEDMMMAAKLLHAGCALAYVPDASVYHAHCYTLREEYQRNVRIGNVMEQYRERLSGAHADAEGWRMLRFVGGELWRQRKYADLLAFFSHVSVRFVANRVGKNMGRRRQK